MHVLITSLVICAVAQAPQEKTVKDKREKQQLVQGWLKVCMEHAKDYKIHPVGDAEKKFKLLPKPIFRHSQPVRGDDIGAVYLWVHEDGRPAVIGTVFAWTVSPGLRNVSHEFHSLTGKPFTATWRGQTPWAPTKPGLDWRSIPDAPPPADTAVRQRLQIRRLGKRFEADSIDHTGSHWKLRLVPQPVYSYTLESPKDVLGGAVLLFCQGTDPEIILSIQARQTDDGPEWLYACGGFSDYRLHVRLDDTEVWQVPPNQHLVKTSPHWWNSRVAIMRLRPVKTIERNKGQEDGKQK